MYVAVGPTAPAGFLYGFVGDWSEGSTEKCVTPGASWSVLWDMD